MTNGISHPIQRIRCLGGITGFPVPITMEPLPPRNLWLNSQSERSLPPPLTHTRWRGYGYIRGEPATALIRNSQSLTMDISKLKQIALLEDFPQRSHSARWISTRPTKSSTWSKSRQSLDWKPLLVSITTAKFSCQNASRKRSRKIRSCSIKWHTRQQKENWSWRTWVAESRRMNWIHRWQ